ncbi:MAG: ribosome small subunit-dependent GTPase A [bacterium]
MTLESLGWRRHFADAFAPHAALGLAAGRVAVEHRGHYLVYTAEGETLASLAGRLMKEREATTERPAVGDWVALRSNDAGKRAVIAAVLPRQTVFLRKRAGRTSEEQVLAANVDTVFIVTAIGPDLSARRIERYLSLAQESGAQPVVVITKMDLESDADETNDVIGEIARAAPVHRVSNVSRNGLDELERYLTPGHTVALLGSSGVGKSTLVNSLAGEERQRVADVSAIAKGRHTTTHRELIRLAGGGLLLDTPGMRELALVDSDAGVEDVFPEIAVLAAGCRFRDCGHAGEPGCAVEAAVDAGKLAAERLEGYRKLAAEARHIEARTDERARDARKRSERTGARAFNERLRSKYGKR